MSFRIEKDTMGEASVPINAIYGSANTTLDSTILKLHRISTGCQKKIIAAFAYLKKAAAITNMEAKVLSKEKCELIGKVCDEILEGKHADAFPLACGKQAVVLKAI